MTTWMQIKKLGWASSNAQIHVQLSKTLGLWKIGVTLVPTWRQTLAYVCLIIDKGHLENTDQFYSRVKQNIYPKIQSVDQIKESWWQHELPFLFTYLWFHISTCALKRFFPTPNRDSLLTCYNLCQPFLHWKWDPICGTTKLQINKLKNLLPLHLSLVNPTTNTLSGLWVQGGLWGEDLAALLYTVWFEGGLSEGGPLGPWQACCQHPGSMGLWGQEWR